MLQQMRQAQSWMIKGVLWAVVLAFVVTIFYSWGVRSSSGPTRSEVATILGEPVGIQEFQRVQNTLYQTYRNFFRNQPNLDLREQFNFREMALEQIARRRLLLQMARENGLVVTDAELYDRIAGMPAFQDAGRFDAARYQAVLRSQVPPIPVQRFEEEQRQALLIEKMQRLVQDGVRLTDAELEAAYRHEHERIAVRYVTLVSSLFEDQVPVTDEDVKAYYETHRSAYREPERRKIRYVAVSPARFQATVDVSDTDIDAYYQTHQEAFRREEQVRARHILFKVDAQASPEEDTAIRARAERALEELQAGADFAVLAKEYSEDPASAERGGDLGFFSRGQMVEAFEETAFTLDVGELSPLVRTPFGYHIIRVEDKTEAEVKPLIEVRQEVIAKLRDEKARAAALAFVDDLMVVLEDAPDQFEALAAQHDLKVTTTAAVAASDRVAGLEGAPGLLQRAFALVGEAVDVVESADGTHYIFQVAEVQPSVIPELAEVEERVRADVRRQKGDELAQQTADEWAAKAQAGTALAELAAPLKVQVVETELFARRDPIPKLGRSAPFTQIAFGLQVGEAGAAHDGPRHFVVQVTERQPADMQAYATEKADYRQQMLRRKQQQALLAFQNALQEQYQRLRQQGDIVVNPQYIF